MTSKIKVQSKSAPKYKLKMIKPLIVMIVLQLQQMIQYQMEEKPVVVQIEIQKTGTGSRRSRKDQEGRDYQCGCGKRYLSYPALYTHIKTKHDGKQPEGTLKTGTTMIAKRAKIKLQEQTLKQVYALFQQFTPQTIVKMDESLRGSFPLTSRIKKDGVPKQVYEQYVGMTKQQQFKLAENSNLDMALALFLINMGDLVNDKVYDQFLIFGRIARACFYQHGEQLYRAVFLKKDSGPFQLKQFNLQHVKYFPIVSDFLIRFYVPEVDSKDTKQANLSLMQLLVYDFCSWLNKLKLTNIKVALSRNVEIDFKPSIQIKVKTTPGKAQTPKQLNEKQMKQQNDEQSEQMSQNEQLEDELQNQEKNAWGSKEQQPIQ